MDELLLILHGSSNEGEEDHTEMVEIKRPDLKGLVSHAKEFEYEIKSP